MKSPTGDRRSTSSAPLEAEGRFRQSSDDDYQRGLRIACWRLGLEDSTLTPDAGGSRRDRARRLAEELLWLHDEVLQEFLA